MGVKICIVTNSILPIPDTLGGAVERIVTMIATDNEKKRRLDLTITTCSEKAANDLQKNYKFTKFIRLNPFYSRFLSNFIYKVFWHLEHWFDLKPIWLFLFSSPVNRYLLKHKNEFDLIVGECAGLSYCGGASFFMGKNKFCVHLHGNKKAEPSFEKVYGNVVSVSDYILNEYRNNSTLPMCRLSTIFNGISTELFQKTITLDERNELRTKLGLEESDFVLIYCGRIREDKGVKELMSSLVSIENPHIKLIIMGSSNFGKGDLEEYPKQVKSIVEKNKDRIVFTGFVPNRELYRYHKIADVGVVPSTHQDPCPLSLIELITSGLPTIATRAGGIPEIGTEETTLYVSIDSIERDLRNAILKLYGSPELMKKMKSAALKRSAYFRSERYYDDFCDTVERLISLNENDTKLQ